MSKVIIVVAETEGGLYAVVNKSEYKIIEASKRNFTSLELSTEPVFKEENLEIYQSGWVALAEYIQ